MTQTAEGPMESGTRRHNSPGEPAMQVRKNVLTLSIVAVLGMAGTVHA